MAKGISGFRSPEDADRYRQCYDRLVEEHWPVPHEELDLPSRFGSTRVRVSGQGDAIPLLLVHPTTGSSAGWYPLIGPLCDGRRAFTPDTMGGAGRSVQTAPITAVGDLVAWLDEVLDALSLDRVHVVGYSEGGWVAASHAALTDRPDRVATLMLIEPSGVFAPVPTKFLGGLIMRGSRIMLARDKPAAVRGFNRWMNGDVELTDAQIELLLAGIGSFRQRLPRPQPLTDAELRGIDAPTRILLGANTKLLNPVRVRERAQRLLPNVEVEVIPDAGHGLAFQHADLATQRILEHAASEDRSGTAKT